MPYDNLSDGLYLLVQKSVEKGVDHYGILDVGNRLNIENAMYTNQPVVVHQTPPSMANSVDLAIFDGNPRKLSLSKWSIFVMISNLVLAKFFENPQPFCSWVEVPIQLFRVREGKNESDLPKEALPLKPCKTRLITF